MKKFLKIFCLALLLTLSVSTVENLPAASKVQTAEAATIKVYEATDFQLKCGKKGQLKVPASFKKPTYKSSNKKVVTVTKKGVMTAVALGEAKITVKYKEKKKVYKVTVIPEKKSDIRLEQDVVFTDETVPLKLVSDKYDTSQVKLKATEYDWLKLDKNAVLNVCSHSELTNANVELQYGSYKFKLRVFRIPPTIAFERVNARHWTDPEFLGDRSEITSDGYVLQGDDIFADYNKARYFEGDTLEFRSYGYAKLNMEEIVEEQITVTVDGVEWENPYTTTKTFPVGTYKVALTLGDRTIEREVEIISELLTPVEAVKTGNTAGYPKKAAAMLNKMHEVITDTSIINDKMSDREKVKAIHDYLIYHANYDYAYYLDVFVEGSEDFLDERQTAYGVLVDGSGVCESYATAFQAFMEVLDIPCKYVGGTGNGVIHGWNAVQIDGKWYYVDCTWDDPIVNGVIGGYENQKYLLSPTLWFSHKVEYERIIEDSNDSWLETIASWEKNKLLLFGD